MSSGFLIWPYVTKFFPTITLVVLGLDFGCCLPVESCLLSFVKCLCINKFVFCDQNRFYRFFPALFTQFMSYSIALTGSLIFVSRVDSKVRIGCYCDVVNCNFGGLNCVVNLKLWSI